MAPAVQKCTKNEEKRSGIVCLLLSWCTQKIKQGFVHIYSVNFTPCVFCIGNFDVMECHMHTIAQHNTAQHGRDYFSSSLWIVNSCNYNNLYEILSLRAKKIRVPKHKRKNQFFF